MSLADPTRSTVPAILLTAVSAGLYAASFPPLSFGSLAWIALVPWLVACAWVTPGKAAMLGALWALLAAYGLASWLPGMISTFFELPPTVGWVGFLAVTVTLFAAYFIGFAAWV